MKHTPGPWLIAGVDDGIEDGYSDGRFVYALHFRGSSQTAVNRFSVCVQNDNNDATDEELRANARLIAAAPELLAALKACVSNHCPNEKVFCSTCSPAREIIAKAEGAQ